VLGAALGRARRVVLVKSLQNDGARKTFVMPTPEILYSLPNAFGHEEEFLGYDGFTARASIVAAQAPALLRDASDKKGERVGAIEEMGFATRVVEKATDRRWAATAGGLVLNPPQEGRKKPREKGASTSSASGAHRIPLREDGTILINYAAPRPQVRSPHGPFTPHAPYTSGAFRDISLARVARGDFAPGTFANAIVLVGSTFTGANDFHFAPLASPQSGALGWASPRTLAGVEIQAHIVDTLLRARPLSEPPAAARWAIAWALSIAALALGAALPWARAALAGGVLAVGYGALSLQAFASDLALPLSLPLGGMLASGLLMAGYRLVGEERQRQAILKLWGRYQHPRVVEYLLHNPHARGGEGEEVPATILFADLKSFTKTVEHLPPGDAIRTLNRYLGLMQECVDENGGLVDKYLGDGLLAQWGAPDEIGTRAVSERADVNAESAVRACWQMMQRADALSAALQMAPAAAQNVNEKTFGLRLSLHSGPVIAGWVGAERIEYTVIGDAVNVCSRLQETAKEMGCDLLISQSTYDNARRIVRVGRTAEVEIRGRDQPLQVYEVVGLREPGEADEPEDADDADGAQPGAQPGAQVLDRSAARAERVQSGSQK
jgi:class 3 adenylate cyclase